METSKKKCQEDTNKGKQKSSRKARDTCFTTNLRRLEMGSKSKLCEFRNENNPELGLNTQLVLRSKHNPTILLLEPCISLICK
jgi:hypothetical protein